MRASTKLMKILVAFQARHPYSFGDKYVLSSVMDFCLNKITDPEPFLLSFERFLIQCMVMIKNILECKEYKPSLTGRVIDENGISLEQMKKNISGVVGGVLTSLLPNERIVFLCNVLITRYSLLSSFLVWFFYLCLSGFLSWMRSKGVLCVYQIIDLSFMESKSIKKFSRPFPPLFRIHSSELSFY